MGVRHLPPPQQAPCISEHVRREVTMAHVSPHGQLSSATAPPCHAMPPLLASWYVAQQNPCP